MKFNNGGYSEKNNHGHRSSLVSELGAAKVPALERENRSMGKHNHYYNCRADADPRGNAVEAYARATRKI
jgi:hypothetical protein